MDLSFSILVDINRLVRIVQFMHTVFRVWVPEAILFYYLLGKGGYVFGSVGLFVCLSVDNIT